MTAKLHTDHHQRLNKLAGTWDTTIVMLDSDGNEGAESQATDTYNWMPNGHFLVHHVDADMGGETIQSTEIFGIDRQTGNFFTRSYDADGSVNDFVANIVNDELTIDGQVQRFAGEFSADGQTLKGQWTQLTDGEWMPFVSITLIKRA